VAGDDVRDNEDSFIHEYIRYTEKQESPPFFHIWSAMTVLSAAMGRKCWIKKGYYVLYPNLFTVLVAGSALCRKSTAVGLAWNLLDGIDSTFVYRGKITPEKLIQDIASKQILNEKDISPEAMIGPNVLIASSELSTFLTKQSYGEPVIYLLTDLFDCPDKWESRTKHSGDSELRNVFVSILAATTPEGIAKGIPESALQDGFASRIMFIYEPSTDRSNAFPELSPEEEALKIKCKNMLNERALLSAEFKLHPVAKAWYIRWYEDVYKKSIPKDKRLEGFFGRKHDHLLRLAMLWAGSYNSTIILQEDCEAALKMLEHVENTARGAFQEIGATGSSMHHARFKAYMRGYKLMHHSLLLKLMYPVNATEFKEIVETHIQTGFISRQADKSHIYVYNEKNDN
jgi:hypothetical protein